MYAYSAELWPPLTTTLFLAILGLYSWQRRTVPGATPFAMACFFSVLWLAGVVAEAVAMDLPTKITWVKFQSLWQLPAITAMTCFVLEFVYPGRWLTRRNLILFAIAPILVLPLVLTNDLHSLMWQGFTQDGTLQSNQGVAGWILLGYSFGLLIINVIALTDLLLRAPQLRWLAALILVGQILGRAIYVVDFTVPHTTGQLDPLIIAFVIPFSIYGIALFGFHIFDPPSVARRSVIDQIRDGMIVLDTEYRVLDLNMAAERVIGSSIDCVRGRNLGDILPISPPLWQRMTGIPAEPAELQLKTDSKDKYLRLDLSPLKDQRGLLIGYLLLLQDVTEQHREQARALTEQWAQATLQEREQIAYDLHDGISQSLAFLHLQARAAQVYLQSGQEDTALATLARLTDVALEMQDDVRGLIGNLLSITRRPEGFCSALYQASAHFEQQTGLPVILEISNDAEIVCDPTLMSPAVGVQLLPIVQEALTNVRKHAGHASRIRIHMQTQAAHLRLAVEDNGMGFDPALLDTTGSHYGLRGMRQRADRIGGQVTIHSAPDEGTCIEVLVPLDALNQQIDPN